MRSMEMESIETEIVVVGSGIAGLTFALEMAKAGLRVLVLTKNDARESNTNYAQGGIAAVVGADDSFELHIQDTLTAGAGLCDQEAVETIVRHAPEAIQWLIEQGTRFSENADHSLEVGREGGHSRHRIVHAKDLTGREIERALTESVRQNPLITTIEHAVALDILLTESGECAGITAFIPETKQKIAVFAHATMLASGGCGQVFRHTTNPAVASGDGYAMAARAGADMSNMEFVQFHPTSLFHPQANSFLISEAVRGFGGELKRRDGSTFMERYHPLASLAPRDVVARAIVNEMRISGEHSMFLDCTSFNETALKEHFPTIFAECLRWGIRISEEMIPVVPAAHYQCGGIRTNLQAETSIKRLYACGEVARTGVHGANRLASNSLLEAVVFAKAAARSAAKISPIACHTSIAFSAFPTGIMPVPTEEIRQLREEIRGIMWESVGILRRSADLASATLRLADIVRRTEMLYRESALHTDLIEVRNLGKTAWLIAQAASERKENCGLHYNLDFE